MSDVGSLLKLTRSLFKLTGSPFNTNRITLNTERITLKTNRVLLKLTGSLLKLTGSYVSFCRNSLEKVDINVFSEFSFYKQKKSRWLIIPFLYLNCVSLKFLQTLPWHVILRIFEDDSQWDWQLHKFKLFQFKYKKRD